MGSGLAKLRPVDQEVLAHPAAALSHFFIPVSPDLKLKVCTNGAAAAEKSAELKFRDETEMMIVVKRLNMRGVAERQKTKLDHNADKTIENQCDKKIGRLIRININKNNRYRPCD